MNEFRLFEQLGGEPGVRILVDALYPPHRALIGAPHLPQLIKKARNAGFFLGH